MARTPKGSVEHGAALCVRGYRLIETSADRDDVGSLRRQIVEWLESDGESPHHFRWRVSLEHLLGRLALLLGDREDAVSWFDQCANEDATRFSPLLATKTVEAAWFAGLLRASDGDIEAARRYWTLGLEQADRARGADWREIVGETREPMGFGLREFAGVIDQAARCAAGLGALATWDTAPGRLADLLASQTQAGPARALHAALRDVRGLRERLAYEAEATRRAEAQANEAVVARAATEHHLAGATTALADAESRLNQLRVRLAERLEAQAAAVAAPTTGTALRVGIWGSAPRHQGVGSVAPDPLATPAWFVDNDPARRRRRVLNLDVIAPDEIMTRGFDAIIVGSMSRDAIVAQLHAIGAPSDRVLTPTLQPVDETCADLSRELARLLPGAARDASDSQQSARGSGDAGVAAGAALPNGNEGYCNICERPTVFVVHDPWLRDHYKCRVCETIPRNRALVNALNRFAPAWRDGNLHESSPGGELSAFLKRSCRGYSSSYFFETCRAARTVANIDPRISRR